MVGWLRPSLRRPARKEGRWVASTVRRGAWSTIAGFRPATTHGRSRSEPSSGPTAPHPSTSL
eukprot:4002187-Prymnesium_polylepis.1